jgi:tetratricopeptide (TPR) repeat protein
MRASALMDGAAHTRDFEDLLFQAWQMRCEAAALGLDPSVAAAASAAGQALEAKGSLEDALLEYRKALSVLPSNVLALWDVGRTLVGLQRHDQAVEILRRLVALDPSAAPAWFLLGGVLDYQGWTADSRVCYEAALSHSVQDPLLVARDLLVPAIAPFGADLSQLRADHEASLRDLVGRSLSLQDPLADLGTRLINAYFRLAYHGAGNRALHELQASLMLKACPDLAWSAPHCMANAGKRPPGPIRIGFISQYFRQHSIGKTSVGLIEQLSRRDFHVVAIFIPPHREDAMSARIAAGADEVLMLPAGLLAGRQAIAALELDVLFYQDIGMEPHSYCLAFARLAPVQCLSFGHPDTTGIPNMDAFISAEWFEPDGAEADYSEALELIKGVGTLAYYDRPELEPSQAVSRAGFGLPDGVPILACPQALFKFHPEMDELIAAVLQRLPSARLLMVQGDVPAYKDQLIARWRARGDGIEHAVNWFPPLEHASFLSLLSAADVVLDTVHFNGMNSSLEAFAMGRPVVTLPGRYQRGRHTQAMYRRMGYADLVARDAAHYVDLVVELATDASLRSAASQRILAACGVLFKDAAVVRGFEEVLVRLVDAHGRHQGQP